MLKFERLEDRRLLDATPMGESYFVFEDWASGRNWVDAEKSPSNTEDDSLCWAAAAANILDWGGWGVGNLDTCDAIFAHLQDHCPDTSGLSQQAWQWWIEGGPVGPMDSEGGYFMDCEIEEWLRSGSGGERAMADIHNLLQLGCGVALNLRGPGGHTITCWGLNYDPDTGEYLGIWVTDADDAKGTETPPDQLRYYEVELSASRWYLPDYYGSNSWYIDSSVGLMGRPETLTPPPNGEICGTLFNDIDGDGIRGVGESGLSDVSVLLDANGNGVHDQTYETFANGDPLMISGETYVVSTLDVGSEITAISDVDITLDISTAYSADLAAWLIAPDGTSMLLFSSIGGSGDGFSDVVFDDEAVDSARNVFDGTIQGALQPFYALSEFDGLDPNGEWQLKIYDRYVFGSATLNGWSLEIAEEEKLAVTGTDGYFTFDGLPPHDYSLVVDIGPAL